MSDDIRMVRVKYIGPKAKAFDNVAGTRLTWLKGEAHQVTEYQASKLIKYKDVWALVDKRTKVSKAVPKPKAGSPEAAVAEDFEAIEAAISDKDTGELEEMLDAEEKGQKRNKVLDLIKGQLGLDDE